MTKAFPISNASISTATVDIQVMRIGTKHMTVAVFRQLPEMDIFDASGYLLAPAWGWVNYDRTGPAKPFVFSYEDVLYRYNINLEPYNNLTVKEEIREPAYSEPVPTGKWIITLEDSKWRYPAINWIFATEASARNHLRNRLIGVAELKDAPQLFIAV